MRGSQKNDIDSQDAHKVDDMATRPEAKGSSILNWRELREYHSDEQDDRGVVDSV